MPVMTTFLSPFIETLRSLREPVHGEGGGGEGGGGGGRPHLFFSWFPPYSLCSTAKHYASLRNFLPLPTPLELPPSVHTSPNTRTIFSQPPYSLRAPTPFSYPTSRENLNVKAPSIKTALLVFRNCPCLALV